MKEFYFVDYNQTIYNANGEVIGRIGSGYIIDRTRSDLIFRGEELGKFINIRSREEIEEFNKVIKKEEIVNNVDFFTAGGVRRVTKEENGMIKNYITTGDGKIYDDNNSYLNFNEKRKMVLMELLDDPIKSSSIASMSPEELDIYLTDAVKGDYKEYYFDDSSKVDKEDEKARLALEKARDVDGKVNSELGIVENGVSDVNDYSTIEERGEGYQVVTPEVAVVDIQSTAVSGGDDGYDASIADEETQEREIECYYLDYEGNVYNASGDILTGVDPRYIVVDEENNLLYNNKKIGVYGGTLNDLADSLNASRDRGHVRTLEKDNAGFGSMDIIMFILVGLTIVVAIMGFVMIKW